jgi:phosphoketolase
MLQNTMLTLLNRSEDEEGMRRFFKQFSFPGGIGSHCTPETPGSIHEGGELGYSISHAFGAAFDNPDLIVAVVVGDGEAETGPLATAWHSNKFLNPVRDGAVLPILHLNGYKIANPTVLARISPKQIESLFIGYGYKPYFVEGSDPEAMHQLMARTLETVLAEVEAIQHEARTKGVSPLPEWPMIVLRTPKGWTGPKEVDGGELSPEGRVMEMLTEHTLEGWLEGYLLTGRHGFFASYEAFIHVIDSMFNQHAKWLEKCQDIHWRAPISSLNILVTSTVWRQDHNGFTHQDPGFLDVVTNKSAKVARIYLPPDANCLLSVADHCLRSTNYVNVIVSDKQPHLQYLTMDEAVQHCSKGIGIWSWASNDQGTEPDVVLACAGDVPTMEALGANALLRENFPDLKIRFINVVDLFKMEPETEHLHGLSDRDFDSLFTMDKPIIFNFHGYPWLIHKLAYRRTNHKNLHVRGYKEKGNINTPLELAIENQIDRFNLAIDVIDRVPKLRVAGAHFKQWLKNQIIENTNHANEYGIDKPEFTNWKWPYSGSGD